MPRVTANGVAIHYEQQGSGEPLVLIPYLAADHMCYAFQVAEYAKHFTCISLDLRGTGESADPAGDYTTEVLADDVAALMEALGIPRAHVAGLSLGACVGLWVAAKYPDRVQSLGLHGASPKCDAFVGALLRGWQETARGFGSVKETIVHAIFPWCFTPELYAARPDYIDSLAAFVRSRPAQTVDSFVRQSNAAIRHDADAQLGRITAPAQITFGSRDQVTSTRFADRLTRGIRNSELVVFEDCAHAPLYERVEEFNARTLQFLQRHSGLAVT